MSSTSEPVAILDYIIYERESHCWTSVTIEGINSEGNSY